MHARFVFALVCLFPCTASAAIADFEDLPLAPNSFHNGNPGGLQPGQSNDGSYVSGGARFNNLFAVDREYGYSYWGGWAYSNKTDVTTPGLANEFSAITGIGSGGSAKYGIAYRGAPMPVIELPAGTFPQSIDVTNTTWSALSMLMGDSFAKKFGDNPATTQVVETNFPDFFKLTIDGTSAGGQSVGAPIDVYLADYRFANDAEDFVLRTWKTIDLSSLAGAAKLTFAWESTDVGPFGMNTPAYFAADNLVLNAIPEPSVLSLVHAAATAMMAIRLIRRRIAMR
jgi:hypothetical protein